jgi:hypothetical protein
MADKKITALTALDATGKDPTDLLHIIDFSASPVNKKITLANLFSNVNMDTHIYGASKTFEIGYATSTNSALKVATAASATADATVTINDDGNAYTDFLIKSNSSDGVFKVDSGTDDVTINTDSHAAVDFTVNGDNGVNIYSDGGLDCVGIGTGTVDGTATLTVAKDATTGVALDLQGQIQFSETPDNLTGAASGSKTVIPITTSVSHLTADGTTNCHFQLADGTHEGQIKILITKAVPNSGTPTVTPASYTATTIVFNAVGESATLMWSNSVWNMIGGSTGTV